MFSLMGLVALAASLVGRGKGTSSTQQAFGSVQDAGLATRLMAQADACAGKNPHEAQELRLAARDFLSVVAQR